jgi:hypothetical protein
LIRIGEVTGFEVAKNRDAETPGLLLQVRLTNQDDVQTIQYINPAGEDATPAIGSQVLILELGPAFRVAMGVLDKIDPQMGAGEKKLYSQENDAISAFIDLLSGGIINLNGAADFAVRFTALETALLQLVTDINAALGGKLDGGGTPGTLSLDISGAKVDEVKLP